MHTTGRGRTHLARSAGAARAALSTRAALGAVTVVEQSQWSDDNESKARMERLDSPAGHVDECMKDLAILVFGGKMDMILDS